MLWAKHRALGGIPYAVKDLFDVAGKVTGVGTSLLAQNVAEEDCYVVKRLATAGMVLIGNVHTVEFASHINGINADLGTPHNPWLKIPYVSGGSSNGSAVAVAAGKIPVALGTNTRGPTGLKPTAGRIGRTSDYPSALSLGAVGTINYLNLCDVAIPCGVDPNGLPIGAMITARPFAEDIVLRIAERFQAATDWHLRRPDLNWMK